jgi:hypothetical protein
MTEKTESAPVASSQADCPGPNYAEREAMIARAAYFRAQQRGFAGGHELEDWLAAEAEVAGRKS